MKIREDVLPVLRPVASDADIKGVVDVLKSGWWGKGPKVAELEKVFAEMVGSKYAVAVTSNTHGLDLVMKAKNFTGVDVINPTMSFLTTAVVPLWNNCTSNIVDVDPDTLCIDPSDVLKSLKEDTEVIIAVNMAGVPAPINEIREFYDGFIIEDCAHSCYTEGAGRQGDVAIWSFQAVKTIACGDGGMITTDDEGLYNKLKSMTWMGISSTFDRVNKGGKSGYTWDYDVDILGYKCYMIDIMASLCLTQLKSKDNKLSHRRLIRDKYNKELHPLVQRPVESDTVQYYCAKVPTEHRDNLIDYLASKKIHTSVHFKPLHKFEVVKQDRDYPVADKEWLKLISLPVHNAMGMEDAQYVIHWVNEFFNTL